MRSVFCYLKNKSSPRERTPEGCWSEMGDSNSQPDGPKLPRIFFRAICSAFPCFLIDFRYSSDLFEPAFFGCSGAVCGHLCGQKRFLNILDMRNLKAFFQSLSECDGRLFGTLVCRIVPLLRCLCKSFLQRQPVRICIAIDKEMGLIYALTIKYTIETAKKHCDMLFSWLQLFAK